MEDQNIGISQKKIRSVSTLWICIYLLLMLSGKLVSSHDSSHAPMIEKDVKLAVTLKEGLVSSSKRTNNAIPEAEESTLKTLRKHDLKKNESSVQNEQLEKPYPYRKFENPISSRNEAEDVYTDSLDNKIHQFKRSGNASTTFVNGNLSVSSPKSHFESTTELESTFKTESEFEPQITTTFSSMTAYQLIESSTVKNDESIGSVIPTNATTSIVQTSHATFQDLQETCTEFVITRNNNLTSTGLTSTEPIITTLATISIMNQPDVLSTENSDILSTITELKATTFQEESPITFIIDDQSTVSTIVTDPSTIALTTFTQKTLKPRLKSTSKPTMTLSIASSTAKTTKAITLMTPTTSIIATPSTITTTIPKATVSTTTTVTTPVTIPTNISTRAWFTTKMTTALRTISRKKFSTSSETYNSFSTWQDENSESTTDTISPTLPTEDVTLLIRIIFEGSWYDVCSKLPALRQSLAELMNNNIEKTISSRQIIFHQTQCMENLTSLISELPLTSVLVYIIDENGNFDGTLTKILPSLYQMTPIDFPLTIHSFLLVPEADSGNAIAVIIVSCVAFICLILLAGLLFIMRKRQGRFNYGERCRPVSLDAYSLDSVSAYNSVRRSKGALRCSKRSYGNPTFEDSSAIPTHPLNFAGLEAFCNNMSAIDEEFASIPQMSSKIDELPPGAELKNRYANVIPLPETRVPLLRLNNDPLTEYINASYIRGPKNASKYYIACQAPTDNTVPDFWRMIWEQQCRVIIMLTDLVENGAEKCSEYIPPLEVSDCHRLYGDHQVTLKKREAKEKYAISTLHLKNLEKNTFREVWHIWYLWPANGTPADGAGLIAVLLEARALQRNATGPIVVHCSPGTGRTGSLIALDLGIRQYEITRTVDVPRVVYTIRRDRAGAVQTREQYAFIYKGLHLYASKLAGGAIEST